MISRKNRFVIRLYYNITVLIRNNNPNAYLLVSVYNALSEKIAKLNAELAPFEAKISQEREAFAQFDHQNQKYNQAKQMKIRSLNTHLSSALEKLQTAVSLVLSFNSLCCLQDHYIISTN